MPLTHPVRHWSRRLPSCKLTQLRLFRIPALSHLCRRVPQGFQAQATLPFPLSNGPTFPTILLCISTQMRHHVSHGHSHHHHRHDNIYLISKNRKDAGVRITRIGLMVNLAMAIGKFIGGYIFHSQALIADAYHAVTDLVSDIMTLGTVAWSLKPPSRRFPNGYGKVESLGALGVSSFLLCGGVLMGLNSGEAILSQSFPDVAKAMSQLGLVGHGHSHGHSHGVLGPSINAIWFAAGSIVIKEWLYRATMRIAKERKSPVLSSNAVHHRIDSLTSVVALATIGGAHIFTDASWLDPVGGLIISLMVIQAGWANTKSAVLELADTTVDDEVRLSVRKAVSKALTADAAGGEIEIRDVQGIKSGQNYLIEIDLSVPGSWSVDRSCRLERSVRQEVAARERGVRRLRIRFVPREVAIIDPMDEFIALDLPSRESLEPEDPELNHDRDHDHLRHDNLAQTDNREHKSR